MWYQDIDSDGYTNDDSDIVGNSFLTFFTYLILTSLLIPISLYVTMEMVKFIQAYFISVDEKMKNDETGLRATARTSNLNEELGQVNFIFSDKTGTLTRNIMEFHSCMVGDTTYGEGREDILEDWPGHPKQSQYKSLFSDSRLARDARKGAASEVVNEFLTLLAVCHTVVPEIDPNMDIKET